MQKILPKKWDKTGSGAQEVAWLEWDGHCMCTKISRKGLVELPDNPTLVDVTDAIRKQIYGYDT